MPPGTMSLTLEIPMSCRCRFPRFLVLYVSMFMSLKQRNLVYFTDGNPFIDGEKIMSCYLPIDAKKLCCSRSEISNKKLKDRITPHANFFQ